ncbi:HPr family phosphocarrier protein [Shewanella marina]|uniref:HPr family phosphocarrier protein n=1 Tax=Shewanella marina TaxID=487319 RepID=UPI0004711504|nr:HPr family phosphocarrier protein [Shewanella marina]
MTNSHQQQVTIHSEYGLHTRPAAQFVKLAKQFTADINISAEQQTVNAKSLFKLQTLGLAKESQITISAQGDDALKAVESLVNFINQLED